MNLFPKFRFHGDKQKARAQYKQAWAFFERAKKAQRSDLKVLGPFKQVFDDGTQYVVREVFGQPVIDIVSPVMVPQEVEHKKDSGRQDESFSFFPVPILYDVLFSNGVSGLSIDSAEPYIFTDPEPGGQAVPSFVTAYDDIYATPLFSASLGRKGLFDSNGDPFEFTNNSPMEYPEFLLLRWQETGGWALYVFKKEVKQVALIFSFPVFDRNPVLAPSPSTTVDALQRTFLDAMKVYYVANGQMPSAGPGGFQGSYASYQKQEFMLAKPQQGEQECTVLSKDSHIDTEALDEIETNDSDEWGLAFEDGEYHPELAEEISRSVHAEPHIDENTQFQIPLDIGGYLFNVNRVARERLTRVSPSEPVAAIPDLQEHRFVFPVIHIPNYCLYESDVITEQNEASPDLWEPYATLDNYNAMPYLTFAILGDEEEKCFIRRMARIESHVDIELANVVRDRIDDKTARYMHPSTYVDNFKAINVCFYDSEEGPSGLPPGDHNPWTYKPVRYPEIHTTDGPPSHPDPNYDSRYPSFPDIKAYWHEVYLDNYDGPRAVYCGDFARYYPGYTPWPFHAVDFIIVVDYSSQSVMGQFFIDNIRHFFIDGKGREVPIWKNSTNVSAWNTFTRLSGDEDYFCVGAPMDTSFRVEQPPRSPVHYFFLVTSPLCKAQKGIQRVEVFTEAYAASYQNTGGLADFQRLALFGYYANDYTDEYNDYHPRWGLESIAPFLTSRSGLLQGKAVHNFPVTAKQYQDDYKNPSRLIVFVSRESSSYKFDRHGVWQDDAVLFRDALQRINFDFSLVVWEENIPQYYHEEGIVCPNYDEFPGVMQCFSTYNHTIPAIENILEQKQIKEAIFIYARDASDLYDVVSTKPGTHDGVKRMIRALGADYFEQSMYVDRWLPVVIDFLDQFERVDRRNEKLFSGQSE